MLKSQNNHNYCFNIEYYSFNPFLNRDIVAELNFPLEAKVTAAPSLNIRKTPDLNLDPIGSISQGQEVLLLEQVEGQPINGDTIWYRIDFKNQYGYVSAQFIEITPWDPELPPVADDQDFELYLEQQGFLLVTELHYIICIINIHIGSLRRFI